MSNSKDILSTLGLFHEVQNLMQLRAKSSEIRAKMLKAQQASTDHSATMESIKQKLGRHLEAITNRPEMGEMVAMDPYVAHIRRVETSPGVWETKVDYYIPRRR